MTNTTRTIPLNLIDGWADNPRRITDHDNFKELKSSILAHGLLQSIVVRPSPDTDGRFQVIAGYRRCMALLDLAADGKIAFDYPVLASILTDDNDALEVALAENVVREPMHPIDQFNTFSTLIEKGEREENIAARFGLSTKTVQQRMRLARVSPKIKELYRTEKLTLAQVQAFAATDDHDRQDSCVDNVLKWQPHAATPERIRDLVTDDEVTATDPRIKFIGMPEYLASGGTVRRDLFTTDDAGTYIDDIALLDRLVDNRLQQEIKRLTAAGWKWVEYVPDYGYGYSWRRANNVDDLDFQPTPEAAAEIEALEAEETAIHESESEEYTEAEETRLKEIETRIEEIQDSGNFWHPDTMATSGVVLTLDKDGLKAAYGLQRKTDAPAATDTSDDDNAVEIQPVDNTPKVPNGLRYTLGAHKAATVAAAIANRPDFALRVLCYQFLRAQLYDDYSNSNGLAISCEYNLIDTPNDTIANPSTCTGYDRLVKLHAEVNNLIPDRLDDLWDWLDICDMPTIQRLIAFCVATTFDPSIPDQSGHHFRRAEDQLVAAANIDMADTFTVTPDNFLNDVSREYILHALTEATGEAVAPAQENMTKDDLVAYAARILPQHRWIPGPLRVATPAPAETEDEAEADEDDNTDNETEDPDAFDDEFDEDGRTFDDDETE